MFFNSNCHTVSTRISDCISIFLSKHSMSPCHYFPVLHCLSSVQTVKIIGQVPSKKVRVKLPVRMRLCLFKVQEKVLRFFSLSFFSSCNIEPIISQSPLEVKRYEQKSQEKERIEILRKYFENPQSRVKSKSDFLASVLFFCLLLNSDLH